MPPLAAAAVRLSRFELLALTASSSWKYPRGRPIRPDRTGADSPLLQKTCAALANSVAAPHYVAMKIASFNINGIKARINALTDWLAGADADVVVLQEIKSVDETFPRAHFEDLGWNIETHGQKGFNGVAILSKLPLEDVIRGLPGDDGDEQSRYIEATVTGVQAVRIAGLYLPNGNPVPGPKYDYKLAWMERLRLRAQELLAAEMPVVMLGDFNIIPEARDAASPEKWRE